MQESLLSSMATDENSFATHQRTLRKDTIAHEIHHDRKINGRFIINTFEFFIIDNKRGFEILAGEAFNNFLSVLDTGRN